jgi:hypothetical protein
LGSYGRLPCRSHIVVVAVGLALLLVVVLAGCFVAGGCHSHRASLRRTGVLGDVYLAATSAHHSGRTIAGAHASTAATAATTATAAAAAARLCRSLGVDDATAIRKRCSRRFRGGDESQKLPSISVAVFLCAGVPVPPVVCLGVVVDVDGIVVRLSSVAAAALVGGAKSGCGVFPLRQQRRKWGWQQFLTSAATK